MKNQELTLLYVFDAIMTEGSITRAADRLSMTQPAVSNSVARMRDLWKDPVFVKRGRNIEPTSYALSLWDQIRSPMHELSNAVTASSFDPALSRRKFRIAVPDLTLEVIWPELVARLEKTAPGIDLHAIPFSMEGNASKLREAQVDIAISLFAEPDASLRSLWLLESGHALSMRKGHPLANTPLSLEAFVAARHLLISLSGETHSYVDAALSRRGLSRRVAASVNHFHAIPAVLRRSDLIAVVPEISARDPAFSNDIIFRDLPIELDPINLYLLWHTRHDRDPGLIWMRKLLEEIIGDQWRALVSEPGNHHLE